MPKDSSLDALIRKEALVAGVSNTVFNGLIAWLLLKGGENMTLGGSGSYAIDIVATAFILPFIVTLIVIPMNKRKLTKEPDMAVEPDMGNWWQRPVAGFPEHLFKRALMFGAVGAFLFAPLTLLPLWALGIAEFTPLNYAIFKGVWAGLLAAALTGPMLLLALRRPITA